jgi:redox-sensitive bicupin YhaK (pirin superfamily)
VCARIIAGLAFGQTSPVGMLWNGPTPRCCSARARARRSIRTRRSAAIYVAEGEVEIAGDTFGASQLLVFRPGVKRGAGHRSNGAQSCVEASGELI